MMATKRQLIIILFLLHFGLVSGRVGRTFSCNHNETKILTYDIVDTGNCEEYISEEKAPEPYIIQMFQKIQTKSNWYFRCHLKVIFQNIFPKFFINVDKDSLVNPICCSLLESVEMTPNADILFLLCYKRFMHESTPLLL